MEVTSLGGKTKKKNVVKSENLVRKWLKAAEQVLFLLKHTYFLDFTMPYEATAGVCMCEYAGLKLLCLHRLPG